MDARHIIAKALAGTTGSILLGIDGIIDEVWEVVNNRTSRDEFTIMRKMLTFGESIMERKTGGLAKERMRKRRVSGGFVCNTGRATGTLGIATTMLGMFGKDSRDTVFNEFDGLNRMVSLGDPVLLNVLEFADGKIMMPYLDELINFRWEDLLAQLGEDALHELFNVDIVGIGYWSNLYDFESIMRNLVHGYLQNGLTRRMLHDFANLNKRTREALGRAITVLGELNGALPMTLSLNEHEAAILAQHLQLSYPEVANAKTQAHYQQVLRAVEQMREQIRIDELIIHTSYFAVIATASQGSAGSWQDYCDNPTKTTGAGDTFNGGYLVAALTDLSPEQRLVVANATTRIYVETSLAPTREQVIHRILTA